MRKSRLVNRDSEVVFLYRLVKKSLWQYSWERNPRYFPLRGPIPNLTWVPLTLNVADRAAKLRAEHRLKTPDAIQAASAISRGATGFICNDKIFERVVDFETLIIEDYV